MGSINICYRGRNIMKKVFFLIVVMVLIVGGVGYIVHRRKANSRAKSTQQEVYEVHRGNLEVKVLATGAIKPYTRVEVKSPTNGRVDQVLVDEGFHVKPGDILAWISNEDRVALLDVARAMLDEAQKTEDDSIIKEAQKSYEIAQRAYKPIPVTNSISGEVIARSCEPGQNVSTQTTLFVISDRLTASVSVDETDIGKIKLGQFATIIVDAFPEEKVLGRVIKIAKEAATVSDVVVYAVIVDPLKVPEHWRSGMTANVEFLVFKKEGVLLIPTKSVKQRGSQKYVITIHNKRQEERLIETGSTDGRNIEVISGLKEGDKVVISQNVFSSKSSSSFQRIQPMMRMIR